MTSTSSFAAASLDVWGAGIARAIQPDTQGRRADRRALRNSFRRDDLSSFSGAESGTEAREPEPRQSSITVGNGKMYGSRSQRSPRRSGQAL